MSEQETIAEQFPWAIAGVEAVIFETGSWGYTNVTKVKITKVSKTRITLEGGRAFYIPKWSHKSELKEMGRDRYRSGTLIATDDPRIAAAEEVQRKEQIRLDARKAAEKYVGDSHSEEKARAAITALQAFLKEWVA
jgi:hypothetical protein